ncbi:MAG: hypothetical protein COV10_04840 [Candidatus Vogelbacteria bacterium CG10_big_fil_rev_8_21_14_0_10_51_16]|uniref:RNA polymerase subunit sigma-70 n=1 Tax=Candidatus Vogelbacteria bacterium CG10_big_fil_rev_8_21_14_0_10_51_16 TaxID=1975045 RepID=A0A2H0RDI5_9BACT|nr:MAG: hypothetical protein COV10_04840 [Candidatus Vogelbacteria bacterium CG10_big_fil_rev_8_21_14_0_10_51_16]
MALLSTFSADESSRNFSDEELLALVASRPSLFALLVERYEDAFRRKVRGIIGNREEVEDVLQEAFTRIYLGSPRFTPQPGATASSWMYRILVNTTFTQYQKLKRRGATQIALDEEILEILPQVREDAEERLARHEYIISILVRMPAALAKVLRLHFLEDKSQQEVAGELGISAAAVKAKVHRAKREFQKVEASLQPDSPQEQLQTI